MFNVMGKTPNDKIESDELLNAFDFRRMRMNHMNE